MEITKQDSKILKGVAVLGLLMLHLFCKKENLPYTPLLMLGNTPLVYYLGLFGDICVPIFCFVSGYAHYMQTEKPAGVRKRWRSLLKFFIQLWTIAILFSIIGLITRSESIPGSPLDFLLNCLTAQNSYNGAWWYANTYLLFTLLQPVSAKCMRKVPIVVSLTFAFFFYCVGYLFRFRLAPYFQEGLPRVAFEILNRVALFMTSFFTYAVGMAFRRLRVIEKLRTWTACLKSWLVNVLVLFGFVAMIAAHGLVQSLFVSVFTGVATVCLLCLARMPEAVRKTLTFLGEHSTCIWLSHMFFYADPFPLLVYKAVWAVPILLLTLALSLLVSFAVRAICHPLLKRIR